MEVASLWGAAFALAVLVEGVVEYGFGWVPAKYKPAVAYTLGVLACVGFQVSIFATYGALDPVHPLVGQFATGLVVGRGSNYIADFKKRSGSESGYDSRYNR